MEVMVGAAFVVAFTVCLLSLREKLNIGDSDFYGMY